MIPDKLYISQLIYGTWQYQTPDPDDETQVEYIRKDALLKWLNELKHIYELPISSSGKTGEIPSAKAKTLQTVIDKLNEL